MIVGEMTAHECIALLGRNRLARLACASDGQPYIVPMHLVYDDEWLYGFSTVGRKIDWLRKNPRVCVEFDEITSAERWACVIVTGDFTELTDTPELQGARAHAYRVLGDRASWWVAAYRRTASSHEMRPLDPIYFRISADDITGRRVAPE